MIFPDCSFHRERSVKVYLGFVLRHDSWNEEPSIPAQHSPLCWQVSLNASCHFMIWSCISSWLMKLIGSFKNFFICSFHLFIVAFIKCLRRTSCRRTLTSWRLRSHSVRSCKYSTLTTTEHSPLLTTKASKSSLFKHNGWKGFYSSTCWMEGFLFIREVS